MIQVYSESKVCITGVRWILHEKKLKKNYLDESLNHKIRKKICPSAKKQHLHYTYWKIRDKFFQWKMCTYFVSMIKVSIQLQFNCISFLIHVDVCMYIVERSKFSLDIFYGVHLSRRKIYMKKCANSWTDNMEWNKTELTTHCILLREREGRGGGTGFVQFIFDEAKMLWTIWFKDIWYWCLT